VFHGGFIGAALAVILYTRLHGKQPLWKIADAFAPSIPLGHALGRLGCLMYGCCFGTVCDLPWAIQFPEHSPAFNLLGQAPTDAAHSLYVHPTQIYSALLNVALYGGLAWLYRHKRFDGQVFGLYLAGYSINRFVVEFFRGDYQAEQLWFGWVKPGQQLSLFLLPIGIALIILLRRRPLARPVA
jgi:phosphatidylglycerol:prolipoprotein diacylglycerol transferase